MTDVKKIQHWGEISYVLVNSCEEIRNNELKFWMSYLIAFYILREKTKMLLTYNKS